jgi:hypothetical protein
MLPILADKSKPLWQRLRDYDERDAFHRRHAKPLEHTPHVGTLQEQLDKARGVRPRPQPIADMVYQFLAFLDANGEYVDALLRIQARRLARQRRGA